MIDRRTGKEIETKYYTGSMVVYHHVNAFEDDGHIVFDIIAYKDSSLYNMFYLSKLKQSPEFHDDSYVKPNYRRFVLPVRSDKVNIKTNSFFVSMDVIHLNIFDVFCVCRVLPLERIW